MFTGTREGQQGSYLKTGLSAFEFLGINPTAAQIQQWTGRENVNEPNYEVTKDFNQKNVRPVTFWLKNDDGVVQNIRMEIGEDDAIANSGNYQVCTSTGSIVWAKSGGIVKPEFADHKPLKVGEYSLISFIAKLINFDYKSGENLYQQMANLQVDAVTLYAGNYAPMNKVAQFYASKNARIAMTLVVREKETLDSEGNTIMKQYQAIASAPETWFHGEVTEWTKAKLLERYEKSLVIGAGQTKAYPLIKELFTIEYQDFDRKHCYNLPADNTATNPTW